jgi:hypothetical protein
MGEILTEIQGNDESPKILIWDVSVVVKLTMEIEFVTENREKAGVKFKNGAIAGVGIREATTVDGYSLVDETTAASLGFTTFLFF